MTAIVLLLSNQILFTKRLNKICLVLYRLIISTNFKFLALVVLEVLYGQKKFLLGKKKELKKNKSVEIHQFKSGS